MKYKVGDKVRIKPKKWFESQKRSICGRLMIGGVEFVDDMKKYCGLDAIVTKDGYYYCLDICSDNINWSEEMFEGLVSEKTPTYKLIKDIAEVIKKNNLGVSVKEEDGRLIIEPLKVEEDLSIDTPCMCSDNAKYWHLCFYKGMFKTFVEGCKSNESYDGELNWNYIIPFDKFNPNDISESLKYNIVKK